MANSGRTYRLYGQTFYNKLIVKEDGNKCCLYGQYPPNTMVRDVIICWTCPQRILSEHGYGERKTEEEYCVRLYTRFSDYIALHNFLRSLPDDLWLFHEVISGCRRQKPRFDIEISDIEPDIQLVTDKVISAMIDIWREWGFELDVERDILMYESRDPTGQVKKQSRHIIVNNWLQRNNVECRELYNMVCAKIPQTYEQYVDHAVYSKNQNFRMINNSKWQSNRVKRFMPFWSYGQLEIEHIYQEEIDDATHLRLTQFSESLCTNVGTRCKYLPPIEPEEQHFNPQNDVFFTTLNYLSQGGKLNPQQLNLDLGKLAYLKLAELAGVHPNSPQFPYSFDTVQGSMVLLKRRKPSMCRLCQRVHDTTSPFLTINGKYMKVYFHCRRQKYNANSNVIQRSSAKKMFVGQLFTINNPDQSTNPQFFNRQHTTNHSSANHSSANHSPTNNSSTTLGKNNISYPDNSSPNVLINNSVGCVSPNGKSSSDHPEYDFFQLHDGSLTNSFSNSSPTHSFSNSSPTHSFSNSSPTHSFSNSSPTHSFSNDGSSTISSEFNFPITPTKIKVTPMKHKLSKRPNFGSRSGIKSDNTELTNLKALSSKNLTSLNYEISQVKSPTNQNVSYDGLFSTLISTN